MKKHFPLITLILFLLNFFFILHSKHSEELFLFLTTGGILLLAHILTLKKKLLFSIKEIFTLSKIKKAITFLFLLLLVVIALGSALSSWEFTQQFYKDYFSWFKELKLFLTITTIALGALSFYLNRDAIKKAEKEKKQEEKEEKKRKENFSEVHPVMNKLPLLRYLLRWMYKEGWVYVLLLLVVILCIFVPLRANTFDDNVGEAPNYGKIKSEIPSAINAYQEGDFFHDENNFYTTVEDQKTTQYNKFPFYVWLVFPLVGISGASSFLLAIKILMLLIDLLILIQLYLLIKKFLEKKFALIATFLFSINIFFQFFFATPMHDRFGLLFFLIGATFLLSSKDYPAYLFAGISFLGKASFFLITIPFYAIIEIFRLKKDFKGNLDRLVKNISIAAAPYLLFQVFIKKIPLLSTEWRIVFILLPIIILGILYYFRKSNFSLFIVSKRFLILGGIFTGVIFTGFLYFVLKKAQALNEAFMTDTEIIFNWPMYEILVKQFASFFGGFIWIFLALGILFMIGKFNKNKAILGLFASAIVYLIMASKSMAMHQYYRHIFVILFIVLMVLVLRYIYYFLVEVSNDNSSKKTIPLIFTIIILFLVAYPCYDLTQQRFDNVDKEEEIQGLHKTADYLRENTNENTNIITNKFELYAGTISLSLRNPCNFNEEYMRDLIQQIGFTRTLKKYNCTYYISHGKSDFSDLLNLFDNISKTKSPSRTEMIKYRTKEEIRDKVNYTRLFDMRPELEKKIYNIKPQKAIKKYNPSQYFTLEKIIGDIYIYKLKLQKTGPGSNNN